MGEWGLTDKREKVRVSSGERENRESFECSTRDKRDGRLHWLISLLRQSVWTFQGVFTLFVDGSFRSCLFLLFTSLLQLGLTIPTIQISTVLVVSICHTEGITVRYHS